MGFLDNIFGSDSTDALSFAGSDYKPTQSNVLGEDLTPKTPQGTLAAVDPDNDSRSSQQFKFDAQNAQKDATNSEDENDDYFVTKNGGKYEKVDNSDSHNAWVGVLAYATNYIANNGDPGQAGIAAGQAVYDNDAKAHRLAQAEDLENKGYNSLDVQNWINSGDKKDLVTNRGQWINVGNGMIANDLTGEFKTGPNATSPNVPVKTATLADGSVIEYYANGSTNIRNPYANPQGVQVAGAGVPGATPTGGGIGIDAQEQGGTQQPAYEGLRLDKGKPISMSGVYSSDGKAAFMGANGNPVDANGNRLTDISGLTPAQQDKQAQAQDKASAATQGQIDMIDQSLNTVNQLITSPGFNSIYGSVQGRLPNLSGDAADAAAIRRQLSGQSFLQARQFLKGQGAISDTESQKAESAMTILNDPTISDEKAAQAAKDYIEILNKGKQRLQGGQAAPQSQNKSNSSQLSDDELLKKYGG